MAHARICLLHFYVILFWNIHSAVLVLFALIFLLLIFCLGTKRKPNVEVIDEKMMRWAWLNMHSGLAKPIEFSVGCVVLSACCCHAIIRCIFEEIRQTSIWDAIWMFFRLLFYHRHRFIEITLIYCISLTRIDFLYAIFFFWLIKITRIYKLKQKILSLFECVIAPLFFRTTKKAFECVSLV